MRIPSDYRAIVKALRRQGYEVELSSGSRHFHVRDPDGRLVTTFGSSPSDHRGVKNFRAKLRREGVSL